jgi:predicted amidophosphoribosyltransferase
MESGDPQNKKTAIGNLCRKAKLYERSPSHDREAAKQLAVLCKEFLQRLTCYDSSDCVVAMPSSRQNKAFDLPHYIAQKLASALGKQDLCDKVRTIRDRRPLKELPLDEKFDELEGSVDVDQVALRGKRVLIVDDLYQSGISLNYVAMLLLQAGSRKVFGLACEKTVRNDDNIGLVVEP